ncbi:hypothetical protein GYO_2671 [Bacillus spizizenii TU-B-10]|uniref:Uncharacterized protein n=1 Tax=Bacillus spizizenii (strain DSM 15029 / JCM 12233 / NBRC 101239 / NRRL B-23049 / TU-B-10) TaxID=1052585 RepID=G4NX96_BACS4|nr:hypothetical protein GYO_2671 [Bacillus spizizenii TU-B-10]
MSRSAFMKIADTYRKKEVKYGFYNNLVCKLDWDIFAVFLSI